MSRFFDVLSYIILVLVAGVVLGAIVLIGISHPVLGVGMLGLIISYSAIAWLVHRGKL